MVLDCVQTSKRAVSLEACTFDETVARMGQFADLDSVTLTVQRLIPRKSVVTVIVGPQGENVGNFTVMHHVVHLLLCVQCIHVMANLNYFRKVLAGYGMNLRTTLQSNNIRL